ncbi:hypothetical protein Slin15195_G102850 [Septoria linicola]|uniref:Mitochondrial ATPase inhibitor n=1 Tax=Septoria linicola TaxID=215465 RepID=A0A9Q9B602_9PEZI|nr:hypothetical protein Slin14017_G065850 [Septoria linicola]USW56966.1 hypothetical protein Slin15195_G102850 [Septoria linicola]
MSALRLTFKPAAFRAAPSISTRSFQTGRVLFAGKETAQGSENPEARKAEIEHHKQAQLKEQKEGKNEWKEAIASESESIAKADRGELKTDKASIKELQDESAKLAQKDRQS